MFRKPHYLSVNQSSVTSRAESNNDVLTVHSCVFIMTQKIRRSAAGQYLLSFDGLRDGFPCNNSVFPLIKKGALISECTLLFLSKRSFSPVSASRNATAANANTSGQQVATRSQTWLTETKNLLLNPVIIWLFCRMTESKGPTLYICCFLRRQEVYGHVNGCIARIVSLI